uniref:Uncharacterized protein n=1 Tax=Glossina morsitans morsitans TaxID=37546 RepID=A0A1B0G940_GLOMM
MESICRLCFQPAALFQVPGYNIPTCVKCSEHLTSTGNGFYPTVTGTTATQAAAAVASVGAVATAVAAAAAVNAATTNGTTTASLNQQQQQQLQQLQNAVNENLQNTEESEEPQRQTRRPRQNGIKNKLQQITMSSFELEKTIQQLDVHTYLYI